MSRVAEFQGYVLDQPAHAMSAVIKTCFTYSGPPAYYLQIRGTGTSYERRGLY